MSLPFSNLFSTQMRWGLFVLSGVPLAGTGRCLNKLSWLESLVGCQLCCSCQALVIEIAILLLETFTPPEGNVFNHEAGTRFVLIKDVVSR